MKKIYLSLISFCALGVVLLMSNAGGPASNGNRATGAPGDGSNTCVSCHNSGNSFGSVSIDLTMTDANGNVKSEYIADSVYEVKVTVTEEMGSPAGYGFSMICLDAEDDNYNGWSDPSSNAQLSTSSSRNYVEHDGISSSNEFTVDWTAPSVSKGDFSFYIGANAVNGASGNNGDNAALKDFTFSETEAEEPNSIDEIDQNRFVVYPNPTNGILTIESKINTDFVIFNSQGQLVAEYYSNSGQIDLGNLPSGFYMIMDAETGLSQKVYKL